MRGYPKHIATRRDLEIALATDRQRAQALLQSALDMREGWHTVGPLSAEDDGVTSERHRVVDYGDAETGPHWYQEEWGPLPGNLIDRLGMSVDDAEELAR